MSHKRHRTVHDRGRWPEWRWRNVPLPEPHLILIGAGLVLHWLRPCSVPIARGPARLVGSIIVATGVSVAAWATTAAGEMDLEQPQKPVSSGPYQYSRHPMYVGWTCIYVGVSVSARSCWLLALLPMLFGWLHATVLAEERGLQQRFGLDYDSYTRRVSRYAGPPSVRVLRARQ